MQDFSEIGSRITSVLSPTIMVLVFIVFLFVVGILTWALTYHWKEYALAHHVRIPRAEKIYLVTTGILFLISLALLITYSVL